MRRAIADWFRALATRLDPPTLGKALSKAVEAGAMSVNQARECADHPGHYPRSHCPATECRYPHCRVDRRRASASSLCTAQRCTLQPFHSPCAHQTALAAKREAKRKPVKRVGKTTKAKR